MKKQMWRGITLSLLVVGFQAVSVAQEAISKTQEQVARTQETAAKNQETAARLAEEAATDPASLTMIRDAAARAREAANRAQDAANRAQEAATKDSASSVAQDAAIRAQEAANRALESANRTQETANRMRRASAPIGESGSARLSPASGSSVAASGVTSSERAVAASVNTGTGTAQPAGTGTTQEGAVGGVSSAGGVSSGTASGANGGASAGTNGASTGTGDSTSTTSAGGSTPQASEASKPAVSTEARDFVQYLNVRTEELAIASLGPKNNTNQSETPSISTNSTSLVEKSSVGDLLGLGFNPAGTSGGSASGDATSTSVTLTGYALKSFLSGTDPLDPIYYNANRRWRKVSFTYGYDFPEGSEGNPRERGNIYGIKFLPYDKRDVSHPSNRGDIAAISRGLQETGGAFANLVGDVQRYIFNRLQSRQALPPEVTAKTNADKRLEAREQRTEFAKFLGGKGYTELVALIGEDGMKEIDTIIAKRTEFARFDKQTEDLINKIRRRPQVSMFFLTKQRRQMRADDYNGGLSLDLGVAERWNLTFNGTFNYTDNKLAADNRGGEFGTELLIPITPFKRLADRLPATFSFAASGEWKTKVAPMYLGQAKLTIPIPFLPGVNMPISVSFASRTELVKESDVRGRVGFTFDMARLLSGLRSNFLSNLPIPGQ